MKPLPPLRALQIFEAVGHCQSINEAANQLQVTPGAISQQLKLLEAALDAALTFKEGKRVRLTSAGQRYHALCSQGFELFREAQAELERTKSDAVLTVSALPSILKGWLAPQIFDWQDKQYPELTLHIKGGHSEPDMEKENVDFRVTYGQANAIGFNSIELYTDCVVPVGSPELFNSLSIKTPNDLLQCHLLTSDWQPKFSSPPSWQEWFAQYGSIEANHHLDNYRIFTLSHMAIEAAVEGQGIALAQYSAIRKELAKGELLIPFNFALALPWPYVMTWRSSSFDKPQCRDFHRWILAQAKQQQKAAEQLIANVP
ncbi:LysR substrate-binding domain-containing protein [Paenalcaligenes niemegkensis]|uniref:LysR substrate-binding domain-containing protein n=1 Tax=Paenalcaligenes niemegkensis TaxID=2895469 RepID=UPI001EE854BD|nr:LysR substrate-binding domain-containing protein [Paenalcaligenes niemegkensis]MCQ9617739.1 LysR substrate-binding domain-containing protein [Paenalcaligenes niemegkensis]